MSIGITPRWEAMMSAEEQTDPGHWHMYSGDPNHGDPYACIRLLDVEKNGERIRRYRVVTWRRARQDRRLVGYYMTLKRACEQARRHRAAEVAVRYPPGLAAGGGHGSAYG